MAAMLKVNDIHVYYGKIHAVKGVSFEVNEGEIVSLIGANGAGKSTILKTVSGLMHPKSGTIEFMGKDIAHMEPNKIVTKGLVHVPEGRRVFAHMSVMENIEMGAYMARCPRRPWRTCLRGSRGSRSGASRKRARFPAASSRCLPWRARS